MPGSSVTTGAPGSVDWIDAGTGIGGVELESAGTNGALDPLPLETIGRPLEPRLIFSLKPSSSTANSVSSERFIRSMICLICLRSKNGLGLKSWTQWLLVGLDV